MSKSYTVNFKSASFYKPSEISCLVGVKDWWEGGGSGSDNNDYTCG